MSKEDGGEGTVSSSVRRTRSSRGVFLAVTSLTAAGFLGRADSFRATAFRAFAGPASGFRPLDESDDFRALAVRRFDWAFLMGRFAERRATVRGRFLTVDFGLRMGLFLALFAIIDALSEP